MPSRNSVYLLPSSCCCGKPDLLPITTAPSFLPSSTLSVYLIHYFESVVIPSSIADRKRGRRSEVRLIGPLLLACDTIPAPSLYKETASYLPIRPPTHPNHKLFASRLSSSGHPPPRQCLVLPRPPSGQSILKIINGILLLTKSSQHFLALF